MMDDCSKREYLKLGYLRNSRICNNKSESFLSARLCSKGLSHLILSTRL